MSAGWQRWAPAPSPRRGRAGWRPWRSLRCDPAAGGAISRASLPLD